MSKPRPIKFIQNAPGKKGKQEYREFTSLEEAQAFIDRNLDRIKNVSMAEKIARKLR